MEYPKNHGKRRKGSDSRKKHELSNNNNNTSTPPSQSQSRHSKRPHSKDEAFSERGASHSKKDVKRKPVTSESGAGKHQPSKEVPPRGGNPRTPAVVQQPSTGAPPQGGNPRNPLVPPAWPTKKPLTGTFHQRVRAFSVLVHESEKDVITRYLRVGIKPEIVTTDAPGKQPDHAVSAGVRRVATANAYGLFHEQRIMRIQSLWGASRDLRVLNTLSVGLHPTQTLQLAIHRVQVVPQDLNRPVINADQDIDPNSPGYLMVDIYSTDDGPFSPDFVIDLLRTDQQLLIWIGHTFPGCFGTHFQEGVWYRDPSQLSKIISHPDENTPSYGVHDACDWIWTNEVYSRGGQSVHWTVAATFGNYKVVLFKRGPRLDQRRINVQPQFLYETSAIPRAPKNLLETYTLNAIMYLSPELVRQFWPTEIVPIQLDLRIAQDAIIGARTIDAALLRTVCRTVDKAIDADPTWRKIRQIAPHLMVQMTERVAITCLLRNLPQRASTYQLVNATMGHDITTLNTQLQAFGKTQTISTNWPKVLMYATAAAIAVYITPWASVLRHMVKLLDSYDFLKEKMSLLLDQTSSLPSSNLAIWASYPLTSALIEEIAATSIPRPLIASIDVGLALARRDPGDALLKTLGHIGLSRLPAPLRFPAHILNNAIGGGLSPIIFAATLIGPWLMKHQPPLRSRWNQFKTQMHKPLEDDIVPWQIDTGVTEFDPSDARVPRTEGYSPLPPQDKTLRLLGEIMTNEEPQDKREVHWLLPTNVPLYAPARSDHNLSMVITHRILATPPKDPPAQIAAWKRVVRVHQVLDPPLPPIEPVSAEADWLAHFTDSTHKARYRAAILRAPQVEESILLTKPVNIMVKTDEVLLKREGVHTYVKPRAIAEVDPQIQVLVGPEIYSASQRLKILWDINSLFVRCGDTTLHLRMTYGVGRTDEDLTKWMLKAHDAPPQNHTFVSVIVAGDDSLICVRTLRAVTFIEGDATMFDQSQSTGPLTWEYLALLRLGVSMNTCRILELVSKQQYVARSRSGQTLRVDRSARPMRDTGGADTSLGNSLVMMAAWITTILAHTPDFWHNFSTIHEVPITLETLAKDFLNLGFKMKLATYDHPTQTTFLKGTWYPVVDQRYEVVWGPLPSRILKVGKTLTDPGTIYKTDYVTASQQFLVDQACNLKHFLQVPLLRQFVRNFDGPQKRIILEPYKVNASAGLKDIVLHEEAYDQMARRYGVTRAIFEEAERQMPTRAFHFMEHELYEALVLKDYA